MVQASPIRCVLVLLVLAAAGCGKATGNVSGKITFKNEPLGAGHVNMMGPRGEVVTGQIQSDGSYEVRGVPVGDVSILVDSRPRRPIQVTRVPPGAPPPEQPDLGRHVPIPERYSKSGQSGLTYRVTKGDQTHNIELEP